MFWVRIAKALSALALLSLALSGCALVDGLEEGEEVVDGGLKVPSCSLPVCPVCNCDKTFDCNANTQGDSECVCDPECRICRKVDDYCVGEMPNVCALAACGDPCYCNTTGQCDGEYADGPACHCDPDCLVCRRPNTCI